MSSTDDDECSSISSAMHSDGVIADPATRCRRYLNTCEIAYSSSVLSRNVLQDSNKCARDVRSMLATYVGFSDPANITFRANTTQALRDFVQVVLHRRKSSEHCFLASDLDHPVMLQMLSIMFPAARLETVHLAADFLAGRCPSDEEITHRYLERSKVCSPDVVLVPHIDWLTGTIFDVAGLCAAIKSSGSTAITVVDGAQALAHIPLSDLWSTPGHIDCYLTCAQKWLGVPEPVGICLTSPACMREQLETQGRDMLFVNDIFSSFAGRMNTANQLDQDSYHLILLQSLWRELEAKLADHGRGDRLAAEADVIRRSLIDVSTLRSLSCPRRKSAIASFGVRDERRLRVLSGRLSTQGFAHSTITNRSIPVLRLAASLTGLSEADTLRLRVIATAL